MLGSPVWIVGGAAGSRFFKTAFHPRPLSVTTLNAWPSCCLCHPHQPAPKRWLSANRPAVRFQPQLRPTSAVAASPLRSITSRSRAALTEIGVRRDPARSGHPGHGQNHMVWRQQHQTHQLHQLQYASLEIALIFELTLLVFCCWEPVVALRQWLRSHRPERIVPAAARRQLTGTSRRH